MNINRGTKFCRSVAFGALLSLSCLTAFSAAMAQEAATTAATQMLPPTQANGAGCVGTNSILSMSGTGTGGNSAIGCSPATLDPSGNFSTSGTLTAGGASLTGLTIATPIGSANPFYGVSLVANGRLESGDMKDGGNGGLWVADSASNASGQFFGSMDGQHVGIWNKPAGVANGAQYWRFIVDSAGNVGIDNQNPQTQLDVSGNENVSGTVTVSGATIGSSTVITANNLANAPACTAGLEALTKNADGSFSCISVSDITGVGKVTVPSCTSGYVLTFDSVNKFTCVPLPSTTLPTCPNAQVLVSNGTGWYCGDLSNVSGGTVVYTTPGTYYFITKANTSTSTVYTFTMIGGGGAGGHGSGGCCGSYPGSGGGGGGYYAVQASGFPPNSRIVVTVGAGGAMTVANAPVAEAAGGANSSVSYGGFSAAAGGGAGGFTPNGQNAPARIGHANTCWWDNNGTWERPGASGFVGLPGGNGATWALNAGGLNIVSQSGVQGGSGGTVNNCYNGSGGGDGANNPGSAGGGGGASSAGGSAAVGTFGGGGGGGGSPTGRPCDSCNANGAGGAGGNGMVQIDW